MVYPYRPLEPGPKPVMGADGAGFDDSGAMQQLWMRIIEKTPPTHLR